MCFPSKLECDNVEIVRHRNLKSSLWNDLIHIWTLGTWKIKGDIMSRMTYLSSYSSWVSSAKLGSGSGNQWQSSPLLENPMMKSTSFFMGWYHISGLTLNSYRSWFQWKINCYNNEEFPLMDLLSQDLRRLTTIKRARIYCEIGWMTISLSLPLSSLPLMYKCVYFDMLWMFLLFLPSSSVYLS